MKALRFDTDLKLVHDAQIPHRKGEALVRVISAGICNTDLEIVKGYAGFRGTPGHEFVGRVFESPDASLVGRRVVGEINAGCGRCKRCLQGDPRHCADRTVLGIKGRDGAFAEYLSLPARNLIELPDSISNDTAVFIEPLAAACSVLEQVTITSSCEVAVVGDGKLAQLVVLVIGQIGCPLTAIGRHTAKLEIARGFGADRALLDAPELRDELRARFDVVVEASGSPSGLGTALTLAKPRGTIILKSTHHQTTALDLSQIVVNEQTIIGSRCGRFQQALDLVVGASLNLAPLIGRKFPLEEGLRGFEEAAVPETMKIILQME